MKPFIASSRADADRIKFAVETRQRQHAANIAKKAARAARPALQCDCESRR
jgi:hypothetical protein